MSIAVTSTSCSPALWKHSASASGRHWGKRTPSSICDDDLSFAQELVCSIYEKHWKKDGVDYKPSDTMIGVLKQIHNLTWYMVKEPPVLVDWKKYGVDYKPSDALGIDNS
jgi:hypothetical protein